MLYLIYFLKNLHKHDKGTNEIITMILCSDFYDGICGWNNADAPYSQIGFSYEPRHERAGLRGFRPGLTQTRLEIADLGRRGIVLSV